MGASRFTKQLKDHYQMRFVIIIILFCSIQGCYYDSDLINNNTTVCDTAIVTYSGTVNPIITAYCNGCHSGPNPPLGVKLDTHAGTKIQASNGKLFGSINHSPGFIPMPKNQNKLSDCNIGKIRKWIAAGAPNN